MVEFVAKLMRFQPDPSLVKGEVEEKTILKATLKKAAYTSEEDGHNLKDGTGKVFGTVTIKAFDDSVFADFMGAKLGDEVMITVKPKRTKK